MKRLLLAGLVLFSSCQPKAKPYRAAPSGKVVELRDSSPLVSFRIVFRTGAAADPAGKEGLASLTAAILARGGTKDLTYGQIVDSMFPMSTTVSNQVDKEMTTFFGVTHADNLDKYFGLLRAMLLNPGWRDEDFKRLRDDAINFLRVSLRGNNDEELGKEVLYNDIYAGHPYGHHDTGTVAGLKNITIEDLKQFYASHYTQSNLILGIAGGYSAAFLERLKKDFETLPPGEPSKSARPEPKQIKGIHIRMIEKQTRSVAYSIGFPISVTRGDPDYLPLLVMQSYFGQHRNSAGRLYTRMRELRGLNYGDYAYIEYFPRGMFLFEPDPNQARPQQIFQIWIRPVEPPPAVFALRLALFELNRLVKEGLSEEEFESTRSYLTKYVSLLIKTKEAELGYAIDSASYGIPDYTSYVKQGLSKLTRDDVNRAIQKHLQTENLDIVVVASGCAGLRDQLLAGKSSSMTYNSPKPPAILEEDKVVEKWPIPIQPGSIEIVPVEKVFE